eukprot:TRINITY_DN2014_c0_g1_i1.p1 TRINITY_DN2014_c0_g1~~TRINITY_DN2014_c0_g1_i1.p1  ORF type:complete len:155 (+),score=39.31 TRINITY_DN2014_c0_g1_i1:115-579(+)
MPLVFARDLNFCSKEMEQLTQRFEDSCTVAEGRKESMYFLRTTVGIRDFMGRLCTYLKCNYETLVVAGVYLNRYTTRSAVVLSKDIFFRLFFAAALVAIKVREDKFFSNKYYSSIWGMPVGLANELELDFLAVLDWDLHVTNDEYEAFITGTHS